MEKPLTTRQKLIAMEGLAALCAMALLVAAACLYGLEPVVPGQMETAKAPWVFVGLQELLRILPAGVAGFWLPLAGVLFLAGLPWLAGKKGGDPNQSFLAARLAAWLLLAGWGLFTLLGLWR